MIKANHQPIILLGMHCSGISLLAGCLSILDVRFGRSIVASHDGNSRQEPGDLLLAHNLLLRDLGVRWDMLGSLPENWVQSPAAAEAKKRILGVIERDFATAPVWSIADARLCRLLPLWNDVFAELQIEPVFLHLVRHPSEVARSLAARYNLGLDKGHMLWLLYHRDALSYCADRPHLLITYDQLLADPVNTLAAVTQRLKIEFPKKPANCRRELLQFVQTEYKHQHYQAGPADAEFSYFAWLYEQLRLHQIRQMPLTADGSYLPSAAPGSDKDVEKTVLPLMLPSPQAGLVPSISTLINLLGILSLHERTELNDDIQRQRRLLQAEHTSETFYARIFFPDGDEPTQLYREAESRKIFLAPGEWQPIRVALPCLKALRKHPLRLDPANNLSLISIAALRIRHAVSGAPLWELTDIEGFDACRVEGTALCLSRAPVLQVLVTGANAHVFLPELEQLPDLPAELEVWIKPQRSLEDLRSLWHVRQKALEELQDQKIRLENKLAHQTSHYQQLQTEHAQAQQRLEQFQSEKEGLAQSLASQKELTREYAGALAQTSGHEAELEDKFNQLSTQYARLQKLNHWLGQLEKEYYAIVHSTRWRVGNAVVSAVERLTFRKRGQIAVDNLEKIFKSYRLWWPQPGQTDQNIAQLKAMLRQARINFQAIPKSRRWKTGHALMALPQLIVFRFTPSLPLARIERIYGEVDSETY